MKMTRTYEWDMGNHLTVGKVKQMASEMDKAGLSDDTRVAMNSGHSQPVDLPELVHHSDRVVSPLEWVTTHGDRVIVRKRRWLRQGWSWHVRARGNHEIVEHGESYFSRAAAIDAAARHHPILDES